MKALKQERQKKIKLHRFLPDGDKAFCTLGGKRIRLHIEERNGVEVLVINTTTGGAIILPDTSNQIAIVVGHD